jgi:hypothetical protein
MADHGYESVEGRHIDFPVWRSGTDICNPITHPYREWRVKRPTLRINVEIPKPDGFDEWFLAIGNASVFYKRKDDRDEAERILVAALRGE